MTAVKKRKSKTEKAVPVNSAIAPNPVERDSISQTEAYNGTGKFPIIGIGASAGGLAAFEAFFSAMPADSNPGIAFVLVQHLAPDHKSILTEIIQRCTQMQVSEVEDGVVVKPNCVYIIPPGRDMAFMNGSLQLFEPSEPHGHRLPIDFFFRSLAQDQRERAICIVLSGTGSDGTMGVRAIKGEGGMAMVQNPESCEYDGMPRSAIATGLVDYELPPAEMPSQLIAYASHAFGKNTRANAPHSAKSESAVKKIFVLLRDQTGNDFSQYKPSTILRRIERRMDVHQINTMDSYVKYIQRTPDEVESLFRDLLIGVTNFFRDADAFKALEEQAIPMLFADKPAGAKVRVWVPSCSTGEEAYSIAILLQERLDNLKERYAVQVFATDIDSQAINKARTGIYPASIAADLTPERLARFFTAESDGNGYRVQKNIRDMVIFSVQNVIKDPPFSKLDLISCRNLMIYLNGELQKKLIPLFHYALNSGGILFLGTSETVGEYYTIFDTLDRKSKIYKCKEDTQGAKHLALSRFLPNLSKKDPYMAKTTGIAAPLSKLPLRELTEQELLKQVTLAAALINVQGDILYLHGKTGMFLEPPPGEVGTVNILAMAREGLKRELPLALHRAVGRNEIVSSKGLRVKTNGHYTSVNLTVRPVQTGLAKKQDPYLYLVVLEEAQLLESVPCKNADIKALEDLEQGHADGSDRIEALKRELNKKEEYLQTANEELETSNEELKSFNEEMQSVNEELQSTNEELETSKEELQSVNEELATVNAELQTNVADLSRTNNDMNNLLAGTGIATIFVNQALRILRFTPLATKISNLILTDIGRPVGHIVSNLVGYTDLVEDVQNVLDTLVAKEVEVQTKEGLWYKLRIQPYRTLENVIEGAVILFIDITEIVQTRESLLMANELLRLAVVVRDSNDAISVQDMEGRILAWNPAAVRMYGWSEAEALKMNASDRIPKSHKTEEMKILSKLAESEILEPYRTERVAKDGSTVKLLLTATALMNEAGQMYGIATTERAIKA